MNEGKFYTNTASTSLVTRGTSLISEKIFGFFFNRSKPKSHNLYTREQVLSILKSLKKNYFPICRYLRETSILVQNNYKAKYNKVPDKVLSRLPAILMKENPAFEELVSKANERVYKLCKIPNAKAFEQAVIELLKSDEQIREVHEAIEAAFLEACKGNEPEFDAELPAHITPDLVLKLYKQIICSVLGRLNQFMIDYKKENGFVNKFDREFDRELKKAIQAETLKREILAKEGVSGSEEHHQMFIFACAMSQFSKKYPHFSKVIDRVDALNNQILQKHLLPDCDLSELSKEINDLGSLPIEPVTPFNPVQTKESYFFIKKKERVNEEFSLRKIDVDQSERRQGLTALKKSASIFDHLVSPGSTPTDRTQGETPMHFSPKHFRF